MTRNQWYLPCRQVVTCLVLIGIVSFAGVSTAGDSEGLGGYKFRMYEDEAGLQKPAPFGGAGPLSSSVEVIEDTNAVVPSVHYQRQILMLITRLALFQMLRR